MQIKKILKFVLSVPIIKSFTWYSTYKAAKEKKALEDAIRDTRLRYLTYAIDNIAVTSAIRLDSPEKLKIIGCERTLKDFTWVEGNMAIDGGSITLRSGASGKTATINLAGKVCHSS